MKKIFLILSVFLAAGFVSCQKDYEVPAPKGEKLTLEVNVMGSAATRATGVSAQSGRSDSADEAKVNTLQVLVFNGDALDGYKSGTSKSVTVNCTSGLRDIYAVVNGPDLSAVTSKTALLATVCNLVEDGDNFTMVGNASETLEASGTVNINVNRLAARVVLRAIKNEHGNATLAAAFKIVSVYLTNVPGDVNLGLSNSYAPTVWYNKRGYQASNNLGSFSYDAVNSNLASGATYSTAHFFYSMPNRYDAASGGVWSPRRAKLVVRIELAGVLYDYPIELPVLQNNKSYEINLLSITKNGNLDDGNEPDDSHPTDTDEEQTIVGATQPFEVTVVDWDVVLVGDASGNITI